MINKTFNNIFNPTFVLALVVILLIILGVTWTFVLVGAQQTAPTFCDDGIVQTPNDNGEWERCDSSDVETDTCTRSCQTKLLGWAWSSTIGWISLSDLSCDPDYLAPGMELICPLPASSDYNILVGTNDNGPVSGYAWADSVGWICFGSACSGQAPFGASPNITLDFSGDTSNPPLQGWAQIVSHGDDGWISLNCSNDPSCVAPIDFKVVYTQGTFDGINAKTLSGWGWNNNANGFGFGWVNFNPAIGLISPWLQTKFGDIYTRGNISGNPTPSSAFNATYRILAGGGVSQFKSLSEVPSGNVWVSPGFGPIDFPTPDTQFSNVLGSLNIDQLIAQAQEIGDEAEIPTLLNGGTYYYDGDLLIDNGLLEFENGSNFENGAGTIIVDGNLTISSEIGYSDSPTAARFRNLASVAWVVLGDLQISGGVENLVGNFIVLGDRETRIDCAAPDPTGCGQIFSCAGGVNCGERLTNSGLMMARRFSFGRLYVDPQGTPVPGGSEIIIYDGRLLANTPPGLGDFAKALPIWRAGTFER